MSTITTETTLATSLHGAKDLRIEDRALPPPGPDELQIQIRATGLCGSDLHYYNHNANGDIKVLEPLTLGHESAGVVLSAGSNVSSHFAPGDKVALEVGRACRKCERCLEGRYNICAAMKFGSSAKGGLPHTQGTLQGRVNHPADLCYKLGEGMSLELGALVEPLSVAIHASRRARIKEEASLRGKVLVFGAGAVGLLCAAVCKLEGVKRVVIADVDAGRVDFAVKNGFAHEGFLVPMRRGTTTEENLDIAKLTASEIASVKNADGIEVGEVDAVFECTGVPSCVQTAIYSTRPGGKILLIGMGTPIQTLPVSAAALREIDLVGVFRYANVYPAAIEMLSLPPGSDGPDFSKLVTHRVQGLRNVEQAFRMAGKTKDESGELVLKVMVLMEEV
ncbi:hypothetical protein FKW77_009432 [Venturia effusa]|uniref:Enoyl reductase (ER) domain-containing protein n=1 Tax=Venturia effusa TaxID=50376 RepID=A0A517LEK5_9PEZI|nr:hypothetical protein FKW77_009432 [Venturia effusa]